MGYGSLIRRSPFVPSPSAVNTFQIANEGGIGGGGGSSAGVVNVTSFGADPTGVADSGAAINSAIASLSAIGGNVVFPPGVYLIGTTIVVGNGTAGGNSQQAGVNLIGIGGIGNPQLIDAAFPSSVVLRWTGATTASMVKFSGPLAGWGMQNIGLDAQTVTSASSGLEFRSCAYGFCHGLSIFGCTGQGILSWTWDPFTVSGIPDNLHNTFINVNVSVPAVVSAKGIRLDGGMQSPGAVTSDTTFDTYANVTVQLPNSALTTYGVYLKVCDTNVFIDTHMVGVGAGNVGVALDYSINTAFPAANKFYCIDNAMTTQWQNISTPAVNSSFLNEVIGLGSGNGGRPPKNIANLGYVGGMEIGYTAPGIAIGTAVTQSGTTASPVTANAICGTITTVNASWTAGFGNGIQFTVNNNQVASTDAITVNHVSTTGVTVTFLPTALSPANGTFNIGLIPVTSGTSVAVVNFAVIKGQNT